MSQGSPECAGTLLVVDDTPANLAVAVSYLEDHGYQVMVAEDGPEALQRAELVEPDLILMDVMMPGIDGFETCRQLKAKAATQEIPVIFMTALTDVEDKVKAFAAGGVDYVTKPFHLEELLARVRTQVTLGQTRLALQQSEVRYRRLFETNTDGVLLLDFRSGRVTDVNVAALEMLGCNDRGSLVGQELASIDAFRRTPCKAALAELEVAESIRCEHWELETQRGMPLDVEFVANVYTADGRQVVQCNVRDITERKEAEARIRYLASHDLLTGLPNRVLLQDRLSQAVAQARRNHDSVAVLMLDLDHFKNINDSLGHHVGDGLLEQASARLRACLRDSDIAARLGGDEFVVVIPERATDEAAREVADKVQAALRQPYRIDEHELHISASIGISRYPGDGDDPDTLLRTADTAMYEAKAKGRGDHCFFTAVLSEAARRRLQLANDLRSALEQGQFEVHYQPQQALESRSLVGMEALLRWKHPREGWVAPQEFVPLLEEGGMIVEVGTWVLRTACAQNVAWQQAGLPPMRMAVNVSAQQFYRGKLVNTVAKVLRETGLAPQWLELELTETLTLDDTETTIRIMNELKELGVMLSLDDFGTGWSSLSYLRRFPLDRLKIDRSFMREVVSNSSASAVVHGIMSLARNLGLTCVAEGVETDEQVSYLRQEMCHEIQGFVVSAALPPDQCVDWLKEAAARAARHKTALTAERLPRSGAFRR